MEPYPYWCYMESYIRSTEMVFLAEHNGKRLGKIISTATTSSYQNHKWFIPCIKELPLTYQAVGAALREASDADACYVRGMLVNREAKLMTRRKGVDKDLWRHQTLVHCIDADHLHLPDFTGDILDVRAVGRAVLDTLGLKCGFIAQFSSSHGKRAGEICIHIWVITEVAFSNTEWTAWGRAQNAAYHTRYPNAPANAKIVDTQLFNENQIHYLADPVFDGVVDYLGGRDRWCIEDGPFFEGPPPVVVRERPVRKHGTASVKGATRFKDELAKLEAGQLGDDGFNGALLRVSKAVTRTHLDINEALELIKPAAYIGAVAAGREDVIPLLDNGKVEDKLRWAYDNLSVSGKREALIATATEAGFEVKDTFAATLKGLAARQTELLAAATATFNRFKHLAPRRMHPGQILRQITDAARLDSAQQKELGALVLEYYAGRRLEVASWLDIKKTADVKNPMEMLRHFRQTQKASWTPLRPSTSFNLDESFGVVPVTTSVVTSFWEAEAACFGDAAPLYIVTAPHGSGKTSAVLVPTEAKVRADGGRTVVLTHRCALASSLCKAFNAADYRSNRLQDEKARSYRHPKLGADGNWNTPFPLADVSCLTVVQDSLPNPNFGAHAARADLLLVDEISQLVAAQGASGSQMSSKTQVAVQRAFFNALQSAKRVILADADVTPATLTYLARAGRPIHIVKVDVPEASMEVRVLHGAREFADVLAWVVEQRTAGRKVCVMSDSATEIEQLDFWCKRNMTDGSFRCVTSDSKNEHAVFLADVNAGVSGLELLAYSPVMGSGVSLVTKHFDAHLFSYHSVVGPTDAVQMMKRDRTCTQVDVMLFNGRTEARATDFEDLWHEVCHKNAEAKKDPDCIVWELDEYALQRANLEAEINTRSRDAANDLIWLIMARGWDVNFDGVELDDAVREAGREVAKESKESRIAKILAAPLLSSSEFDALKQKSEDGKTTREEGYVLEHQMLRRNIALPHDSALDRHQYDLASDDRTMQSIRKMGWLLASDRLIAIENLRDLDRPGPDVLQLAGRQQVLRAVLGWGEEGSVSARVSHLIGNDLPSRTPKSLPDNDCKFEDTLLGVFTLTSDLAKDIYDRLFTLAPTARAFGISLPKTEPSSFVRWCKGFLESLGFRFGEARRIGERADRERVFDLDVPATREIAEIALRRNARAETLNGSQKMTRLGMERAPQQTSLSNELRRLGHQIFNNWETFLAGTLLFPVTGGAGYNHFDDWVAVTGRQALSAKFAKPAKAKRRAKAV